MHHSAPRYPEFIIKWATLPWEVAAARALRRRVFCEEQGLFHDTDEDDRDPLAQALVALAGYGGWPDQLVGTVRIHPGARPGQWWGSRLAVAPEYRREASLGPALIRLAVGSARGLGCTRFDACVQAQNENLFQRLHWRTCGHTAIHGLPHVLMRADLAHYPACSDPRGGFVVRSRYQPPRPADIAALLSPMAAAS